MIYIKDLQRLGIILIDQTCRNNRGMKLDKIEIFWDIYTYFVHGTLVFGMLRLS